MSNSLTAETGIFIPATPERVWEALTQPEQIKKYFFGTNAESDWKVGSRLDFKGTWEGKEYHDKGFILESDRPKIFRYSYWSAFSGTEDKPENYAEITYRLRPEKDGTYLQIRQGGVADEERKKHSEQNWAAVLKGMKEIIESEN